MEKNSAPNPRRVVFAGRELTASAKTSAPGPSQSEDLIYRGGRTLADMAFKTFYIGKGWDTPPLTSARRNLDAALSAAMSDKALNAIVAQYFKGGLITTDAAPSVVLDQPPRELYTKDDIHALAQQVFKDGVLAGLDLKNAVINFILPPKAILSADSASGNAAPSGADALQGFPEAEEADSRHGLGGYHGSIHVTGPGAPTTIYYAAAVWSEGDNGIPIPGWAPWENVCATLYHELNEARTDPDVEEAIRTGKLAWIGWNSNHGEEIGDFPIRAAGSDLTSVFRKVPVDGPPGVAPIQLMWSNRIHGAEHP